MPPQSTDLRALLEVAGELYAADADAFVSTRDARAAALRGEDRDLAARVKKLRKPSAGAWVLNRLARSRADGLAALDDVGRRMREAQSAGDGPALKDLRRELRTAVDDLLGAADDEARDEGAPLSATLRQEVAGTLRAVGADPGVAAAVRSGLLVRTVSATGLDRVDVDEVVAVPGAVEVAAADDGDGDDDELLVVAPVADLDDARAKREERRARERDAQRERQVALARRTAESAERAADRARTEHEEAQEALVTARERLEDVEQRLATARERVAAAEEHADGASTAADEAQSALEEARAALADAEGGTTDG